MNPSIIALQEGISIVQQLEPLIAPLGFHAGLTGSVLFKGVSAKDLDIIIYDHDRRDKKDRGALHNVLREAGFTSAYPTGPSCNDKDVVVYKLEGRRVDLFFL